MGLGGRQAVGSVCCFESDDGGLHESDATGHPVQKVEGFDARHRNERPGVWQVDANLRPRGHADAPSPAGLRAAGLRSRCRADGCSAECGGVTRTAPLVGARSSLSTSAGISLQSVGALNGSREQPGKIAEL